MHKIAHETNQAFDFDEGVKNDEEFKTQQLENTNEILLGQSAEKRLGFDELVSAKD